MKINKLFGLYDSMAFSLYRMMFYFVVFIFYSKFAWLPPSQFGQEELKRFFEPVTFFKLIDYNTLFMFDMDVLHIIWKTSLVAAGFGLLWPVSSFLSFALAFWFAGIPLNFGKIHHVNHMLVMVLGILAFSMRPGKYSADAWLFRKYRFIYLFDATTSWPLLTIRIYMTLTYFGAGFQKLRHGGLDWIFSDNMSTIIITRPTVTDLGLWVADYHIITITLAFFTVFFQLTAPISLISKRFAAVCMTSNFFMHIGTYMLFGNHGYFFPYNLCYVAWLPWEDIASYLRRRFPRFQSIPRPIESSVTIPGTSEDPLKDQNNQ